MPSAARRLSSGERMSSSGCRRRLRGRGWCRQRSGSAAARSRGRGGGTSPVRPRAAPGSLFGAAAGGDQVDFGGDESGCGWGDGERVQGLGDDLRRQAGDGDENARENCSGWMQVFGMAAGLGSGEREDCRHIPVPAREPQACGGAVSRRLACCRKRWRNVLQDDRALPRKQGHAAWVCRSAPAGQGAPGSGKLAIAQGGPPARQNDRHHQRTTYAHVHFPAHASALSFC
jgi:hypothetical protein